jgi:hypothetical protein
MKRIHLSPLASLLFLLPSAPALAGGAKQVVPSGGDWEFSLSAGPVYRNVGEVEINAGYRSGGLALPSFVGGNVLQTPAVGETGVPFNREYNDGFVRQDAGTPNDGSTWNWGHDSDSQVQNDQLVYRATGFRSDYSDIRNAPATGPSQHRNLEGIAPHLQFNARSPHRLGPFRVGFTAGLDFVKTDRSLGFSNFSAGQTRVDYRLDYEDRYDLGGVIPPLAPYQGSLGGAGPVISNFPASRDITPVLLLTENAGFANQVSTSFDLDALSLTLGPTLALTHGSFDFAVSGGFTLNIYSWQAAQKETLDVTTTQGTVEIARWSEDDHGVKFRPGAYLQGEAGYSFTERIGMTGFLRIDAARSFSFGAGPTTYEVDPYGITAGVMLRFTLP